MERVLLKNIEIENTEFEYLYVYIDKAGSLLFLPFLWLVHICSTKSHYVWITKSYTSADNSFNKSIERVFEQVDLSDNTIRNYVGHFFHFLQYIEEHEKKTVNVHNLEMVTDRFLNSYINTVLPARVSSKSALIAHKAAIDSFFNFLNLLEIRTAPVTRVFAKTKKLISINDDKPKKISYISRTNRHKLLSQSNSKSERLILRMGFEVGLRTSECCGLVLEDVRFKNTKELGILSLFKLLNNEPSRMLFPYLLLGKYSKGGRTRTIYFERELLAAMKDYYETERSRLIRKSGKESKYFFIRADRSGIGMPISTKHATNVFTRIRKELPYLNQRLSFHDLRHTFATELYKRELIARTGRETRSESAALLVVSRRLGHKDTSDSSKLYIRLQYQLDVLMETENHAV